jgi:predicted dehydrogenase
MKLALLGADDDALALVRWAIDVGGHDLSAAFDFGNRAAEVHAIAPRLQLDQSWESLVATPTVDAVIVARAGAGLTHQTGIADAERRADQFRKLAQAAVPMIVVCPACEAIVGFEIEMIRRDTQGVIIPYIPGATHPAINRLAQLVASSELSPIGRIEQITFERQQADRSRQAVLVQLARDVALLRKLIGTIQTVSATGPAAAVGRDPLGPKPKEPPSLANLSIHFVGEAGLAARWSVAPAHGEPQARLTVLGANGTAVVTMPSAGAWSIETAGDSPATESFGPHDEAEQAFRQLPGAAVGQPQNDSAWLGACRDQEAAEAVDRSLLRGRTIELFNEEHTEEESFKGVMAMGGCLLLLSALAAVLLATVVEGLRLPMRNWPLWRLWPVYLLVPIGAFLLLQLLQFSLKREESGPDRLLVSEQLGKLGRLG